MSANDVQNEILDPMQRLFLPPRNMPDEQVSGALREYVASLQEFDGSDLRRAWETVRDTHTTRGWPVPAAFKMAAMQARKERKSLEPRVPHPFEKHSPSEGFDGWKSVRNTALAKEAVKMRVAWALKCAVLNDNKRPEHIDLKALAHAKSRAEATAARIQSGELRFEPGIARTALNMWRTILIREAETEQEINYRGAA